MLLIISHHQGKWRDNRNSGHSFLGYYIQIDSVFCFAILGGEGEEEKSTVFSEWGRLALLPGAKINFNIIRLSCFTMSDIFYISNHTRVKINHFNVWS